MRKAIPGILCFLIFATAEGQTKHSAATKPVQSSKKKEVVTQRDPFTNLPFVKPTGSLSTDFRGVNPRLICDAVKESSALSKKSEFETTVAYTARLASFPEASLLPGLKAQDMMAFVFGLDSGYSSSLSNTYDADAQAFTLAIQVAVKKMFLVEGSPEMAEIKLSTRVYDQSTYTASNAMGAKVEVEEVNSTTYGLAIEPYLLPSKSGSSRYGDKDIKILVPAAPEIASTLKPQLRIAIVGQLRAPWLAEDVFGKDPTISDPYKFLDGQKYLVINPLELIVFRADTGEILKDMDFPSAH